MYYKRGGGEGGGGGGGEGEGDEGGESGEYDVSLAPPITSSNPRIALNYPR